MEERELAKLLSTSFKIVIIRVCTTMYTALCSSHSEEYTHCSINPQKTH